MCTMAFWMYRRWEAGVNVSKLEAATTLRDRRPLLLAPDGLGACAIAPARGTHRELPAAACIVFIAS